MAESQSVEMTEEEIDAFVQSTDTGVLALPASDQPYAIPVSYAYDAEDRSFLLRLGHLEDTAKDRYLEDSTPARLVVYDESVPRSVIADGTLHELEKSSLSPERIRTLGDGETPAFELWEADKAALDVTIHELGDAELTGRKPPDG